MRKSKVLALALGLAAILGSLGPTGADAQSGRPITLAVVSDGPSRDDKILDLMVPELDHLLGAGNWRYKRTAAFDANWDFDRIPGVIAAALADPEVDLVVGVGRLVTQTAAAADLVLTKPLLSATIMLGDVPPMPLSPDDHSTKENFTFIVVRPGEDGSFRAFLDLTGLRRIHLGIGPLEIEHLRGLDEEITVYEQAMDVQIELFPVTAGSDTLLARLNPLSEGFVLTSLPRLRGEERQAFIDALNRNEILSMSFEDGGDLERGVLATNMRDLTQQTARRAAGNIHLMLGGEPATNLPVFLQPETGLRVNARTAAAIGFVPGFKARIMADLVHPEALESALPRLDFPGVLELAEQGNAALGIARARAERVDKTEDVARADMLPQINALANYTTLDADGLESLLADQLGTVGFTLSQMIYDDRIISDFRSAGRRKDAAVFRRETERLDILTLAGKNFLEFVLSRLNYDLEIDNLRLTEANLDLARIRVDVGNAGPDEVYRWEAEVAKRQGRVVDGQARMERRRIALNQTLGLEQDRQWRPVEIEVRLDVVPLMDGRLDEFLLRGPVEYREFGEAAVAYALTHGPEVGFYGKLLEAQEIQVGQRQRSFFLPRVGAHFRYDFNVYKSQEEGLVPEGSIFKLDATLPLFEGTRRIHETQRQKASARRFEYELVQAQQLVERRVRNALAQIEASYPNLDFTRTGAEKALRNLEVVREKYASGIVNITRVLEAQNNSFTAQQAAAGASYVFLADLVDLQRALAFFGDDHDDAGQDSFVAEIRTLMADPGNEP